MISNMKYSTCTYLHKYPDRIAVFDAGIYFRR